MSQRRKSNSDPTMSTGDLFDQPYLDPYDESEGEEADVQEAEPEGSHFGTDSSDIDAIRRDHRLVLQKVDFLLPQLITMMKDGRVLDITPKYQRRFRWQRKKQSLLIESLLLNIPMPSIFLYEKDLAEYEVMDGRQRLSTVFDFMKEKGGFKLQGLEKLAFLNGKDYKSLPEKVQATLRRASFPVTIILSESDATNKLIPRLRQLVFERLNTGGQILNSQEVRNCIYDGAFNDMLVRVARSALFTKIWGIPPKEENESTHPSDKLKQNRYFATMTDCEIVLRYFAFADTERYTVPKKSLDDFIELNYQCSEDDARSFESDYLASLELAYAIFGYKTFRVYPHLVSAGKREDMGKLSAPLSDAVLLACKKYRESSDSLVANKAEIIAETEALMMSRETYDALIGSKNTRTEFKRRIELVSSIFEKFQ